MQQKRMERKLHWAGKEGESIAIVIPKITTQKSHWEPGMDFFTLFGAGIARDAEGNVFPGPNYEPLCGDTTLESVRACIHDERITRIVRERLAVLLSELEKFRGPNWV
jgi:hypothetical protein